MSQKYEPNYYTRWDFFYINFYIFENCCVTFVIFFFVSLIFVWGEHEVLKARAQTMKF